MKKNNLLKTVLWFVFVLLMMQSCREESTVIENQNLKSKISYKKFNDLPFLKKTVEKVEKEFNSVKSNSRLENVEAISPGGYLLTKTLM